MFHRVNVIATYPVSRNIRRPAVPFQIHLSNIKLIGAPHQEATTFRQISRQLPFGI